MSAPLTRAQLTALPKAHLHLHLEGSARPATIAELAEQAGIGPLTFACESFATFDRLYSAMLDAICSPEQLARICRELVEDEAAAGVAYVEPSINPLWWADRLRISNNEALAVMRAAFADAGARHGVEVGLMLAVPRFVGAAGAEAMATFAAEHAGDAGPVAVVSFGICGDEPADAHRPFARAAAIAHEASLLVVPHVGEQQGAASVAEALELLAPDRIAHGFRAVEDPDVLARLCASGAACDVCVTSNVAIGTVASVEQHPLPRMVAAGVPVTLGTDDALFFGVDLVDEYATAQRLCGLDAHGVAQIARDAAHASGASARTQAALHDGIDAWLADAA